MEIKVVLGQVGEDGHIKCDPLDTTEDQRMAGHLHGNTVAITITHERQKTLHRGCFRCRACHGNLLTADAGTERADESRGMTQMRENGIDEMRDGRLAVGSSDANAAQPLRWMIVQPGSDLAGMGARLLNEQDGDAGVAQDLLAGGIGQDCCGVGTGM